ETGGAEIGRVAADDRPALEGDRATIGDDDAGEQLDQRALARAVLAQNGVDRAGREGDGRAVERHRLAVALREIPDLEHACSPIGTPGGRSGRRDRLAVSRRYLAQGSGVWA